MIRSAVQVRREAQWRDGRAVECTSLENWHTVTGIWGSNPCLSANCRVVKRRTPLVYTPTRLVGAENEIDKWYGLTTKPAYFVIYQIAAC